MTIEEAIEAVHKHELDPHYACCANFQSDLLLFARREQSRDIRAAILTGADEMDPDRMCARLNTYYQQHCQPPAPECPTCQACGERMEFQCDAEILYVSARCTACGDQRPRASVPARLYRCKPCDRSVTVPIAEQRRGGEGE